MDEEIGEVGGEFDGSEEGREEVEDVERYFLRMVNFGEVRRVVEWVMGGDVGRSGEDVTSGKGMMEKVSVGIEDEMIWTLLWRVDDGLEVDGSALSACVLSDPSSESILPA